MIQKEFYKNPKKVRILETWTGHRGAGIHNWIRDVVKTSCSAEVRILLLDPESHHVGRRAQDMDWNEDMVRFEITADLEKLETVRRDYSDKIEIRVYDSTPVVNMFAFDDTRIFGLYLRRHDSTELSRFIVNTADSFLAGQLDDHFEALWDEAQEILSAA